MTGSNGQSKPPADGLEIAGERIDALLVASFGGPEGPDEVLPFLENVTGGRGSRERLEEVAHHYERFGGVSPLNAQNRTLIESLRAELDANRIGLPIYFGNRHWRPFLADTLREMTADGVRCALAFVTSAYSSYAGCRLYREAICEAQALAGPAAPEVAKLRVFHNHPGFVEANADRVRAELAALPEERRARAHVAFTAHSIPLAMARRSRYERQLAETARLVAAAAGATHCRVVYQSRSGPPQVPWLEPDILDHLRELAARGTEDVVVAPIGFVSDHMEVLYDLDVEARELATELGLGFARAGTAGTHPAFVAMVRELVEERLDPGRERRALGRDGPFYDVCPPGCCLPS